MSASQSCIDRPCHGVTPGEYTGFPLPFMLWWKSRITPSDQRSCTQRCHTIVWWKYLPEEITVNPAVTWKCSESIKYVEDKIVPETPQVASISVAGSL